MFVQCLYNEKRDFCAKERAKNRFVIENKWYIFGKRTSAFENGVDTRGALKRPEDHKRTKARHDSGEGPLAGELGMSVTSKRKMYRGTAKG